MPLVLLLLHITFYQSYMVIQATEAATSSQQNTVQQVYKVKTTLQPSSYSPQKYPTSQQASNKVDILTSLKFPSSPKAIRFERAEISHTNKQENNQIGVTFASVHLPRRAEVVTQPGDLRSVIIAGPAVTNTADFPRPQLYRFGFVTYSPVLREIAEEKLYAHSNREKSHTTMAALSTFTLVATFFAVGFAVTIGALLMGLLYRRRRSSNSAAAAEDADTKYNVQVIGAEMCHTLSAVPVHPLTTVANAEQGLGQLVLMRSSTTTTGSVHFINQFSDVIGQAGGKVDCPTSDVSVTVPHAAVTEGIQHVFINVSLCGQECGAVEETGYQLSPVVELLTDSSSERGKPVTVQLPHSGTAGQKLRVRHRGTSNSWHDMDSKVFYWDNQFMYITAHEAGMYVVVTDKASTPSIRMCMSVWSNQSSEGQAYYRIYCCHDNKDMRKRVHELECVYGGHELVAPHVFLLDTAAQEITVAMQCIGSPAPVTKALRTAACLECYDPPQYVDMTATAAATQPAISFSTDTMPHPAQLTAAPC